MGGRKHNSFFFTNKRLRFSVARLGNNDPTKSVTDHDPITISSASDTSSGGCSTKPMISHQQALSPSSSSLSLLPITIPFKKEKQKSLCFGNLQIRSYSQTIGDHPCCNTGCPLSLGWDYFEENIVSIDEYESSRGPRRNLKELRSTWDDRREVLAAAAFSPTDVRRANRRCYRERSTCRGKVAAANASFFRDDNNNAAIGISSHNILQSRRE